MNLVHWLMTTPRERTLEKELEELRAKNRQLSIELAMLTTPRKSLTAKDIIEGKKNGTFRPIVFRKSWRDRRSELEAQHNTKQQKVDKFVQQLSKLEETIHANQQVR